MTKRIKKLYLNAGQMKAGTTFLFSVMRRHPDVYFSPEKEIHYLCTRYGPVDLLNDGVRLRKAKSILDIANKLDRPIAKYKNVVQWAGNYLRDTKVDGWYEDIFKGHRAEQWCADFSNLTCRIPVDGLKQVADIADDVRVTYCIRDSVSRAISHAKFHLRFSGLEHNLSALDPSELRALLLSANIFPQSQSLEHVEALRSVFGKENFRIIRCEALWRDPRHVVDQLCDFLEIGKLKGEIASEAVNVGPKSEVSDAALQVFNEIFGRMRAENDELLEKNADILIQ